MGIVTLFVVMMLLQMAATYFESQRVQQYFQTLKQRGNVLVGKKRGYFFSGSIVLFVLDNNYQVLEYHIRQGVSVFSRFHATILETPTNFGNLSIKGNKQLQQAIEQAKSYLPD